MNEIFLILVKIISFNFFILMYKILFIFKIRYLNIQFMFNFLKILTYYRLILYQPYNQ